MPDRVAHTRVRFTDTNPASMRRRRSVRRPILRSAKGQRLTTTPSSAHCPHVRSLIEAIDINPSVVGHPYAGWMDGANALTRRSTIRSCSVSNVSFFAWRLRSAGFRRARGPRHRSTSENSHADHLHRCPGRWPRPVRPLARMLVSISDGLGIKGRFGITREGLRVKRRAICAPLRQGASNRRDIPDEIGR